MYGLDTQVIFCVLNVQHAVLQIVFANFLSMELVGHVAMQMQQVSGLFISCLPFFFSGRSSA